jgi:general stress protein 26
MGNYKQLSGREAIDELKEIVDHQRICMMVTDASSYPGHSRPMAVSEVDEAGAFWFLTLRTTDKLDELTRDPRMSLYFSNPSDQEFLTIHGNTEVLNDMARKKELWNPIAEAWVPDGVENPDLRLLKLTPDEGYYWDTMDGKVAAGIKILFSLLSKKKSDDGGVEGELSI